MSETDDSCNDEESSVPLLSVATYRTGVLESGVVLYLALQFGSSDWVPTCNNKNKNITWRMDRQGPCQKQRSDGVRSARSQFASYSEI